MTLLFAWATYAEAQAFLQKHNTQQIDDHTYECDLGKSIIIGMGPSEIGKRLLPHLDKNTHLINVGLAGALKKELQKEQFCEICSVSHEKQTILCGSQGFKLMSVTNPLYKAKNYQSQYDLVDMEGFFLAQFAMKHKVPYTLFKMVSDFCNDQSHEEIKSSLPKLSEALKLHLTDSLPTKFIKN